MTDITENKIIKKQNWTMWTFFVAFGMAMFSGYQYTNNKYESIINAINQSHFDNGITGEQVKINTKRIEMLEDRQGKIELRQDKVEVMVFSLK